MDEKLKTLYVFPDTNVLVQCKQLGELDWNALGKFSEIVLILARPVIGEIDHQKGGVGRLAKRARTANGLLRRLLDEDTIKIPTKTRGIEVTLRSGDDLRASADLVDQLDYSTADDKLVGTVHKYLLDNPNHQVLFLSHDTGPLMTAKRLRVPFQRVPDSWLLSLETDDEQKQIKFLQEELKRSERREPECQIEFLAAPWILKIPRYRALTERQIDALVQRLKHRHPCETEFETEAPPRSPYEIAAVQLKRFVPVSAEQIRAYEDSYQHWVEAVSTFFRTFNEKFGVLSALPTIEIALINVGTSPARNVEVRVEVCGGRFSIFAPSTKMEKIIETPLSLPPVPLVPKAQWKEQFAFGAALLPHSFNISPTNHDLLRPLSAPDPNKFYWKDGRPTEPVQKVSRECAEWRHHDDKELVRLRLAPSQSAELLNDAIKVTIRASNLSQPVQSIQAIRFEYEELDLLAEAEELVSAY
ncbi:PIN domain-containing protein [Pseudomonas sp. PB3P13]